MSYDLFLARKRLSDPATGFRPAKPLPLWLFPHQRDITQWALRRGRAAIFAGTGLGKTAMELVWADQVEAFTDKPVLILAPLAVSHQHQREAWRFGVIGTAIARDQSEIFGKRIVITNYAKLDHFDLSAFGGIVLDESSILKAHDGKTRARLIEDCQRIPFRLAATATPAPNDFMELGNHAEFLGVMTYSEMLAMFFVHDGGETRKWRLKGHGQSEFWRWMSSWSVMLRRPSELGYSNDGYDLPPLMTEQHTTAVEYRADLDAGTLFPIEARTMQERIGARRSSVNERVQMAVSIVIGSFRAKLAECGNQNTPLPPTDWRVQSSIFGSLVVRPWVIWCQLNSEQKALEAALGDLCISITGSQSDDDKERLLVDWLSGKAPILVTKCSIFAYGLNLQHCADTIFVGLNDSFEQVFQAIRRFWRFGQSRPVTAHFIASELEGAIVANLRRKEADAELMAAEMVAHMADLSAEELHGTKRDVAQYQPSKVDLPPFMRVA